MAETACSGDGSVEREAMVMAETACSGDGSVEREAMVMVNGKRRKLKRAAAAITPFLPDDLVLWEILVRLPAKELLRCRAACRSWRRLTRDAEFLLAHHRHQPSLPLVFFRVRDKKYTVDASVHALDLQQPTPAVRRPIVRLDKYRYPGSFVIYASCDGLLLLSDTNRRNYIYNPTTGQWLKLPAPTIGIVAAFYRHRPSGEYRILYWNCANGDTNSSVQYYILTVGSSEGHRCIGLPVVSPSLRRNTIRWLIHAREEHPPALLHDCLHWYINSSSFNEGKILAFDTLDESFRWMRSPITTNSEDFNDSTHLCRMDGTLGVRQVDQDTMTVQVWTLQDYEAEVWSLKQKIQLPVLEMAECMSKKRLLAWETVCDNGDMLLSCCIRRLLFQVDSKGKLVNKFGHDYATRELLHLSFKESLVSHVFFERRDDHKLVKLPRFLRGL